MTNPNVQVSTDYDGNRLYQGQEVWEYDGNYYPITDTDGSNMLNLRNVILPDLLETLFKDHFDVYAGIGSHSIGKAISEFSEMLMFEVGNANHLDVIDIPDMFEDVDRGQLNSQGEIDDYWDVN